MDAEPEPEPEPQRYFPLPSFGCVSCDNIFFNTKLFSPKQTQHLTLYLLKLNNTDHLLIQLHFFAPNPIKLFHQSL